MDINRGRCGYKRRGGQEQRAPGGDNRGGCGYGSFRTRAVTGANGEENQGLWRHISQVSERR